MCNISLLNIQLHGVRQKNEKLDLKSNFKPLGNPINRYYVHKESEIR
jgi:hypothetical protein